MTNHTPSLAIPGLGAEQSRFHAHGLYWLACDGAEDAVLLCRQVLAALAAEARAALIADAQGLRAIVDGLGAASGPAELALYEADARAVRHLADDLPRLDASERLLLACLPAALWQDVELARWCRELAAAARAEGAVVLLVGVGLGVEALDRLHTLNQELDGLAQLYHGQGGIRYLLHFWRNALGLSATQDVELVRRPAGFVLAGRPQPLLEAGDDERLYLVQRQVLEGAPALSEHWQLFDDMAALGARAGVAVSATVIFAAASGQRLDLLARQLHSLRQLRGNALKLVVRETGPTLRYQDEQLLLACGASLIMPFGASLSRFLTLVDSIQGYVWPRSLPADFDALLRRLRPLPLCGLVAPRAFAEAVREMWQGLRNGEIVHQFLVLSPTSGLSPLQICARSAFRRDGDIVCVVDGQLFLFLFACRTEGVEQALDHLFHLSWKELFVSHELLASLDILGVPAFLDDNVPALPAVDEAVAPRGPGRAALMPRLLPPLQRNPS